MNQRRSLSQALQTPELTAEALAVIREGSIRPVESRPTQPLQNAVESHSISSQTQRPVTLRQNTAPEPETLPPPPRGLVPLSVRVNAGLADALLKVAFERKLQRKQPFSQQDIVTQALTQWLRRNGYDDGK